MISMMLCRQCRVKQANYVCPKCSIVYCSVGCYQKHSEKCTEEFYRDCVVNQLKSMKVSDRGNCQRIKKILKRNENLEDEDQEYEFLSNVLKDIEDKKELDLDEINALLGEEIAEDFRKSLSDGRMSRWVEIWTPWWNVSDPTSASENIPELDVVPFENIFRGNPSPFLPFNLLNILYSFTYVILLYNGTWDSDSQQLETVLCLCPLFTNRDTFYDSIDQTLSKSIELSIQLSKKQKPYDSFPTFVLKNLVQILKNKKHIEKVMNYLSFLFSSFPSCVDCKRKVYYYACWLNSSDDKVVKFLRSNVKRFIKIKGMKNRNNDTPKKSIFDFSL